MLPRVAALVAALFCLLALPAIAGANPSISVDVVSATNLSRIPAFVGHRLTLTAGAQDESVRVTTNGSGTEVGGSAQVTENSVVPGEALAVCPGNWSSFHHAVDRNQFRSAFRIPAGTTATVTVPVRMSSAPFVEETLDAEFELQFGEQKPFTVVSEAPGWSGPIVPDMSLFVLRGANRTTVLTGQADGATGGRVEIWAFAPKAKKARLLKTVRAVDQGNWSWAGWRPHAPGAWELYARYRRTATSPRTGATECGLTFTVLGVAVPAGRGA
jgi:hypothetical protein